MVVFGGQDARNWGYGEIRVIVNDKVKPMTVGQSGGGRVEGNVREEEDKQTPVN